MSASPGGPSNARSPQPDESKYPYLTSLNPAQLSAVTATPSVPIQILAGPGSGKTRVLTSRVAYLVQHHGYRPHEITAVTFTNKAAAEMKKRLRVLLGEKEADNLVLGTFHATCARYLRRYAGMIGLAINFAIADADDCKKTMSRLIKAKADILEGARISLKDSAVLSEISKAKAKEETPDGMAIRAATDLSSSTSPLALIAELYAEYEAALRESNSLDFDDLLVFGLKLFRSSPRVLDSCKHILVDEFQDTNTTQYELMKCFARAAGGVSVVGDPDQSIYGWRSAEIENLNRMAEDFPGTRAIYLEENYRSTGSILAAAHSVVSQDRERIQKSLYTSHPRSTPVCLKTFSTPVIEASFISVEIKRLIAYSGGTLNYGDFAILLRYNALSRIIESTLQKDSIPNKIVGGHKFFERMEIKDMLAYLQLAENPNFTPAFVRVVNVPKRAIGDKTVADLLDAAKKEKMSPMELSDLIIDGGQFPVGIKPAVKQKLAGFVGAVRKLRRAAQKGMPVAELIRLVIDRTGYEEYLRTSKQDWESRWENVQELITYSVTVAEEQAREGSEQFLEDGSAPASSAAMEAMVTQAAKHEAKQRQQQLHPLFRRNSSTSTGRSRSVDEEPPRKRQRKIALNAKLRQRDEVIEVLSSDDEDVDRVNSSPKGELEQNSFPADGKRNVDEEDTSPGAVDPTKANLTPLSYFLQTSMLSTDTESNQDDTSKPKVTITTVHSAKGLEWPVVFIPAVEQGTYPSYRCTEAHEVAEERRLLYVAMTRAQTFLTISHCHFRMMGGEESDKEMSEFIKFAQKANASNFSADLADVDLLVRRNIASMLDRPVPDEEATKDMVKKHIRGAPPISMWDAPEPRDHTFNRFGRREVTKAARAAEYWESEFDEYALPGKGGQGPNGAQKGFVSARAWSKPKPEGEGSPKPDSPRAPVRVQPSNHFIPAPMPFTWGGEQPIKKDADLGLFTNASSSFLDDLSTLGLPEEVPKGPISSPLFGSSPRLGGSPLLGAKASVSTPPRFGGLLTLESVAKSTLGDWDDLAAQGAQENVGLGVPLAKGTKRLGMGRPGAWGTKKARQE